MPLIAYLALGGAGVWAVGSAAKGVEEGVHDATKTLIYGALIVGGIYLLTQKGK